MISKKPEIFIIGHDFRLNQTFTNRYFSFLRVLNYRYDVYLIGLDFPFKSHPINNLNFSDSALNYHNKVIIKVKSLNCIQKLISVSDKLNMPYFLKKILLAIHILIYKVDQWVVKEEDFNILKVKPDIIIAGGTGGVAKISALLAKKYKAKLIIDYRDPWNFGYNLLETNNIIFNFKKLFTIKIEIKLLNQADYILTVSESLKLFFPQKYQNKIKVIENGSNYTSAEVNAFINSKPSFFNIVYLGTIYDEQIKDETFFRALNDFIDEYKIEINTIKLYFLGSSTNRTLSKIIAKYNFKENVFITERLTREELIPYLSNASLFLHLKYSSRSKIITSKNSDYLAFRKPILLPLSDHGDLENSIRENNSGYVCNSKKEIKSVLNEQYQNWLKEIPCEIQNFSIVNLERDNISKKLDEVVQFVIKNSTPPSAQ
ncbi:hypothetical protein PBAC_07390 [Pedobacter glucosidilyticus]|nr:hypothetical protein PBAC_07390 [Pedobacter glucosidilyticus]